MKTTNPPVYAQRIRHHRLRQQLTQRNLAEGVGIDHTYLCHIEKGRRTPSLDVLEALALGLGIDMPTLFTPLPP
jgi:transcriptional regulator with XRE-family HTH domain